MFFQLLLSIFEKNKTKKEKVKIANYMGNCLKKKLFLKGEVQSTKETL